MKKGTVGGTVGLIAADLLLFYLGLLYRAHCFSFFFGLVLFCALGAVPPLMLAGFRRLGRAPAWLAVVSAFPVLLYGSENLAVAVLVWALCCGTPLAVTLFWDRRKSLEELTFRALPVAALLWLGGAVGYSRLHLGGWSPERITQRIAYRYELMVSKLERFYTALLKEEMPEQLVSAFKILHEQVPYAAFRIVALVCYGLVGCYFLAILLADRSVPEKERRLGSWSVLVPRRGVGIFFMLLYLGVTFFGEGAGAFTLKAVLDLFGFFFVFTAVYRILGFMRKKQWPPLLRVGIVVLLFALSYLSAGDASLSAYMILLIVGWWIVTTPPKNNMQPKI